MAFITDGAGNVTSYCDASDVKDKDQRVFESNEISYSDAPDTPTTLDEYIEDLATKGTNRINQKIRASAKWRQYLGYTGEGIVDINNIPAFNPNRIVGRQADFSDMCSYYTLKEYILPKVADFGDELSPEVQKIQYYENKFQDLYTELTDMWDWYDREGDGIDNEDRMVSFRTNRRTRNKSNTTRVR
tara:strand:- start:1061 stop:1621 length:561 start_codon:yes stop_codon:yes gene_type:complete